MAAVTPVRRTRARGLRQRLITASLPKRSRNGVPVARISYGLGQNEEGHTGVLTQSLTVDVSGR
jgi:hypothetical protein